MPNPAPIVSVSRAADGGAPTAAVAAEAEAEAKQGQQGDPAGEQPLGPRSDAATPRAQDSAAAAAAAGGTSFPGGRPPKNQKKEM